MKKNAIKSLLVLVFVVFATQLNAEEKKIEKKFNAKSEISVSTISGNCMVYKGETNEILISLTHDYSNECFEYTIDESSNSINIIERFHGSCSGESEWIITVPQNTNVDIKTVSGDVLVVGVNADIDLSTVSGDIALQSIVSEKVNAKTVSGDFKVSKVSSELSFSSASGDINISGASGSFSLSGASGDLNADEFNGKLSVSTASGDLTLNNSKGVYTLKTASGDISAEGNIIEGESVFSTASGDVEVGLNQKLNSDLKLSSASGDVTLNYNGNELEGNFEFQAKVDKGKIVSPVKFDKEEVITKSGDEYNVKSFTAGSKSIKIKLKTASGTVKLVK